MKLQILIPQYNETDEIVKPMLDSLLTQQNIDFNELGIIIVNDGSNILLSDSLLKSYPFQIDYYKAPHRGVSATRNTCLDYAVADYIMFCDADDMFCNVCGLWMIFREISYGFDTLSSKFLEETRNPQTGEIIYINRENDNTFVHGKVHRRQYLIDNNIRWNPELTIHEDSFFNAQCSALTSKPKYLDEAFYLWKYRADSVCRKDKQYILKTLPCLIDSIDALINKLENSQKYELAVYYTVYLLMDIFYTINKPEWRDKNNIDFLRKVEKRSFDFFKKYQENWKKCSMTTALEISQKLRAKAIKEGMLLENITITEWLAKLDNYYKV